MINQLPIPQAGFLVKIPRDNHERIVAPSLKPPEMKPVENSRIPMVRFVNEQHKELKLPCSKRVFEKVLGKRRKKAAHTGLDLQIYTTFVLVQERASNTIVGVDAFPQREIMHNFKPVDEPAHGTLVMLIDPETGDMTVEDFPSDVNNGNVLQLMAEIDRIGQIKVGDMFSGFQVQTIADGRVYFNTDEVEDADELIDDDNIFYATGTDIGGIGTGK